MSLMGLNRTLNIIRRTETVDAIGGVTRTESTVASNIQCRLGNASNSEKMRLAEQGYESLRAHKIILQPATTNVLENDIVVVSGTRYIVRSVIIDNLLTSDSRSHLELLVERYEEARSTP